MTFLNFQQISILFLQCDLKYGTHFCETSVCIVHHYILLTEINIIEPETRTVSGLFPQIFDGAFLAARSWH